MSDSAFKNFINKSIVESISRDILKHYPEFDAKKFIKVSEGLGPLELKARVLLITANLHELLPAAYPEALKILVKVMKEDHLSGFSLWPFSEFIGQHGLSHFDESMKAMYVLTQKFTAEFAIRPFLNKDHKKVLIYFEKWADDDDTHVRRWVSEGSRPLLPWGERIPEFVKDPTHTLPLLEKLKYDEELYVRKSVANHLNDISKHHPLILIKLIRSWEKDCPKEHRAKIEWIKKHALRTLIKKGHPEALKLMGVAGEAKLKLGELALNQKNFKVGDRLSFNLPIVSTSDKKQKLVIDYILHFMKSNGTLGHKVFKLKVFEISPKEKCVIEKTHHLKKITTMKFYEGKQGLSVQINGKVVKNIDFKLKL